MARPIPSEIVLFVGALLTGAHYAKGSRFVQGGGTADMPLYRQLGNQALVILTNVLFGTRYTDITYGYNAFWRSAADALALDIDGWPCEIISNIRAVRNGLRVVEIASFRTRADRRYCQVTSIFGRLGDPQGDSTREICRSRSATAGTA